MDSRDATPSPAIYSVCYDTGMQRIPATICLAALCLASGCATACDLRVLSPWIREAPPAMTELAAYAILQNTGATPLTITGFSLPADGMVMLHETRIEGGVSRMRMLEALVIPAGGRVALAPGGKHLMLMNLKASARAGERLSIAFTDASGCRTAADFVVRPISAGAPDP